MRGTMRILHSILVMCLRGPCFPVPCNVHVLCKYTCGSTCMKIYMWKYMRGSTRMEAQAWDIYTCGSLACADYAFKIAYYAFEQCFKFLPIMPKLCLIMLHYAHLIYCYLSLIFNFSISKQVALNLAAHLILDNYFLTELSYNRRDGIFLKQE